MPEKKTLKTPAEILATALKKEKIAFAFYSRLLQSSNVDFVQDLLTTLRDEEIKHVRMIEKKIADLNMGRG